MDHDTVRKIVGLLLGNTVALSSRDTVSTRESSTCSISPFHVRSPMLRQAQPPSLDPLSLWQGTCCYRLPRTLHLTLHPHPRHVFPQHRSGCVVAVLRKVRASLHSLHDHHPGVASPSHGLLLGVVVAPLLVQLQGWSMAQIAIEYERHSFPKPREMDMKFVQAVDVQPLRELLRTSPHHALDEADAAPRASPTSAAAAARQRRNGASTTASGAGGGEGAGGGRGARRATTTAATATGGGAGGAAGAGSGDAQASSSQHSRQGARKRRRL